MKTFLFVFLRLFRAYIAKPLSLLFFAYAYISAHTVYAQHLILLDHNVADKQLFYRDIQPNTQIIELPYDYGLDSLAQLLSAQNNLMSLHIVTHGESGHLQIGPSKIGISALITHPTFFPSLNQALVEGADLLLYACNLGEGDLGQAFFEQFAAASAADIALSIDDTGATQLGGDWQLELQSGHIQTQIALSAQAKRAFSHTLDGRLTFDIAVHSGESPSVSDTVPQGVAFSNDGSAMFIAGRVTGQIYQFALSTPFDVTSATQTKSFSVAAVDNSIMGLTFSANGSRLFVMGIQNDSVLQYSLDVPFDLGSVTLDGSYEDVGVGNTFGRDVYFDPSGLKMFLIESSNDRIEEYSLTNPYDITSGVSHVGNTIIEPAFITGEPSGLYFTDDGSELYVSIQTGADSSFVRILGLSNSFDRSTLVPRASFFIGDNESQPTSVVIEESVGRIYVTGRESQRVQQFDLVGDFNEVDDTGSVSGNLSILVTDDTFVNPSGTLTSPEHFSIAGLPSGLVPSLAVSDDGSRADLSMSGAAISNDTSDNLSDMVFTFTDSAFAGGDASVIEQAIGGSSTIGVTFNDTGAPELALVTPVTTPTDDRTPNFTFNSDQDGILEIGGSCGTSSSTSVTSGEITITLTATDNSSNLADASYTNCTLTVTNSSGNSSAALSIPTFTVTDILPDFTGEPSVVSVFQETITNIDLSAATLSDPNGDPLSVTMVVANGVLSGSSGGGVTVSGSDSNTLVLSGTLINLNNFIDSASAIAYTGDSGVNGMGVDTLTVNVSDGTNNPQVGVISIDIDPNRAPVLDASDTPTFTAIDEDAGDDDGSGADGDDDGTNNTNNDGEQVAAILASVTITDLEPHHTTNSLVVTAVDNVNGAWQFSLDNGSTWSNFTDSLNAIVDIENQAIALSGIAIGAAANRIRFVPESNFFGTASLTFRAWDESQHSAGIPVDASINGGQTAFSSESDTLTVTVNAINDLPVLTNLAGDILAFRAGQNPQILDQNTGATVADVDGDFTAGFIRLEIISNLDSAEDLLGLDTSGVISASGDTSGSDLLVGGETIGTLGADLGVGNPLLINLNAAATNSHVQSLIRGMTYQNIDLSNPSLAARTLKIELNDGSSSIEQTLSVQFLSPESDGSVTTAPGVLEPVSLSSTIDTEAEALDIFDFILIDAGTDSLPLIINQIQMQVSGTATASERASIEWLLSGSDASNVIGVYNPSSDSLTFSGLNISVADGTNETYVLSAFYSDNSSLTDGASLIVSVDPDSDFTIASPAISSTFSSSSAISNGSGSLVDIVATRLVFATQPSSSVSGVSLGTQPVVHAVDAAGNLDRDVTDVLTLSESSGGSVSNQTASAVAGVATFSGVTYSASADNEAFTLQVDDEVGGAGGDLALATANTLTSDVVATRLVFIQEPIEFTPTSEVTWTFEESFVVQAQDAQGLLDDDFSGIVSMLLDESASLGDSVVSIASDLDFDPKRVSLQAEAGEVVFTALGLVYQHSTADDVLRMIAASQGLASALSVGTANVNVAPTIELNGFDASLVNFIEDVQGDWVIDKLQLNDADLDLVSLRIWVDRGSLALPDEAISNLLAVTDNGVTVTNVTAQEFTLTGAIDVLNAQLLAGISVNYTSEPNQIGDGRLSITVADQLVVSEVLVQNLSLTQVADPIEFSGEPAAFVGVGQTYSFTPATLDVDQQNLTYQISNKPQWAEFETSTGRLFGVPESDDLGLYQNIQISLLGENEQAARIPAFAIRVRETELATNSAPTIVGSPEAEILTGSSYTFTPTATDPENDSLTFTITNLPSWAVFDENTGTLTGTPLTTNIGDFADIRIQASDGFEMSNALDFSIHVILNNQAPIADDILVMVQEDASLSILPEVSDADGDAITFSVQTSVANGQLTLLNGRFTYIPNANFSGQDSFTFIANDGQLDSQLATISIEVLPENDAPVAVDDVFSLMASSDNTYRLSVLDNDFDPEQDVLTLVRASSNNASIQIDQQVLIVSPTNSQSNSIFIEYLINDVQGASSSAVAELSIDFDAQAQNPVISLPESQVFKATGTLTKLNIGIATARDQALGQDVPVSLLRNNLFFRPGRHLVPWQAEFADGEILIAEQLIEVEPLVSLQSNSFAGPDSQVEVRVYLNGEAPNYPVVIPFEVVSNNISEDSHTARSGEFVIESGTQGQYVFEIESQLLTDGSQNIEFVLDESVNSLANNRTRVTLVPDFTVLSADFVAFQQAEQRTLLSREEGDVRFDTHLNIDSDLTEFRWQTSQEVSNLSEAPETLIIDPTQLLGDRLAVTLTITDRQSGESDAFTRSYAITDALVPLTEIDTDADGIADILEGWADDDSDGIANVFDTENSCHVLPQSINQGGQFLVEGNVGVCLSRGENSIISEAGSIKLNRNEALALFGNDTEARNVGGIFDFIAHGLSSDNSGYQVVLPQSEPIPAGASYRKYIQGQWQDFVQDQHNQVLSTKGERGVCPPPNSPSYTQGLTEGDWCVSLVIQDGGPNDGDGLVNQSISDPGGVAVAISDNRAPIVEDIEYFVEIDQLSTLDVLSQVTDPDGDPVRVVSVSALFGQVELNADSSVSYLAPLNFRGIDKLVFGVSDGLGGTAWGQTTVNVIPNESVLVASEILTTDDVTLLPISLLSFSEGVTSQVQIVQTHATLGKVTVVEDGRIIYLAPRDYLGMDTVEYTVQTQSGQHLSGSLSISVVPSQFDLAQQNNAKQGGSVSIAQLKFILFAVLFMLWGRRRNSILNDLDR